MDSSWAGSKEQSQDWPLWVNIGVPVFCVIVFFIVLVILVLTYRSPTDESVLLMTEVGPSTSTGTPQHCKVGHNLVKHQRKIMMEDNPPVRSYMDNPSITWRYGKPPDYTLVNRTYMQGRVRNHAEGSLEKIVENLVKTWEMEASHKTDPRDWGSVDPEKYSISANNSKRWVMSEVTQRGTYNMLMADSPLYDAASHTFQSSHDLFKTAMPNGFAWELLEVIAGPPRVVFTWRHWGYWDGVYENKEPTGELLEMFGLCVVSVNNDLKIETIEVYYDPNPFIAKFMGIKPGCCPVSKS